MIPLAKVTALEMRYTFRQKKRDYDEPRFYWKVKRARTAHLGDEMYCSLEADAIDTTRELWASSPGQEGLLDFSVSLTRLICPLISANSTAAMGFTFSFTEAQVANWREVSQYNA
jgi:hypothetical protein